MGVSARAEANAGAENFIVHEQFGCLFHAISHPPVVSGRVLLFRCVGSGAVIPIANCRVSSTSDGALLHRRAHSDISLALPFAAASFNLVVGVWNLAPEEEGAVVHDGHTWHSGGILHRDVFNVPRCYWIEFCAGGADAA
eukprot:1168132-Pyramimonas_sp.AAC.1